MEQRVPGLMVFAMKGQVEHYEEDNKFSKFYDYKAIVPATKDKKNGLKHADDCPAWQLGDP